MIGLGSNRLTIARRGGMSVTQAGRGGMEWLGYRVPSWASPYSAQATAALKAQFPTQWPTIRDYGFAHPEIVGYMNAYAPEDAKIAYSLVPTLNTIRTLNGVVGAYINTGVYANQDTGFDITLIPTDSSNSTCGMFSGSTSGNDKGLECYYWSSAWNIISNNAFATGVSVYVDKIQRITRLGADWSVYVDGELKASGTHAKASTFTSNSPICLCTLNRNNSKSYQGKPRYIKAVIMQDGGAVLREMYPFIRKINGVDTCGMIDVLSGTFYQNAGSGSFTISETPAS